MCSEGEMFVFVCACRPLLHLKYACYWWHGRVSEQTATSKDVKRIKYVDEMKPVYLLLCWCKRTRFPCYQNMYVQRLDAVCVCVFLSSFFFSFSHRRCDIFMNILRVCIVCVCVMLNVSVFLKCMCVGLVARSRTLKLRFAVNISPHASSPPEWYLDFSARTSFAWRRAESSQAASLQPISLVVHSSNADFVRQANHTLTHSVDTRDHPHHITQL